MQELLGRLHTLVVGNRFVRNWTFLVISNVFGQLLGMLATIRIARLLEPAGYGEYNVILTVASIGTVLAGVGMRNVITRECARHPEQSGLVFLTSLMIQGIVMLVVGAGIMIYGELGGHGLAPALSAVAIGVLIGQAVWELVEAVSFGYERMGFSAAINLLGSAVWVGAVWSVPSGWVTLPAVSVSFAVLAVAKGLAFVVVIRGAGFLDRPAEAGQWLRTASSLVRQSLPFYWLAVLTAVSNQLPILFLVERSGEVEVGLYNVGFRLVNPLQMLVYTALLALYPGLSRAGVVDSGRFMQIVRRALLGITFLGTAGAIVISLLRYEVVLILFGGEYLPSADAMAYLVWFSVLYALYCLIGITLAARDRQGWLAWLATAYALFATPLLWWGSGYGATGLAMGVLGGAIVNSIYHAIVFHRSLPEALTPLFGLRLLSILGGGLGVALLVPQSLPFIFRLAIVVLLLVASISWIVRDWRESESVSTG